ncbi:DNA excision repair protein ERCC-6-like 2 [Glandiceps talaboti]
MSSESDATFLESQGDSVAVIQHLDNEASQKSNSQESWKEEIDDSFVRSDKVWCVGDKCLAEFPGDGDYYNAVIRLIKTTQNGRKVAVVRYTDYDSDENETLPFTKLKESAGKMKNVVKKDSGMDSSTSTSDCGMFSPLKGNEVRNRIRDKYADLMEEDNLHSMTKRSPRHLLDSPTPSLGLRAKRQKGVVATGGAAVGSPRLRTPKLTASSPEVSKAKSSSPMSCSRQEDESSDYKGFEDEDMERPHFPGISNCGQKEPLILGKQKAQVIQVPATINRYLREYQREGVQFLYKHYQIGEGAILGDDMGLGKTIQVISFICAILGKTGTREDCQRRVPEFLQKEVHCRRTKRDVFLIASPKSVMYNWLDELETWSYLNVGKYHGKDREDTLIKAMKGKLDVVLTTHETLRISVDDINRVSWSAVIVDEVHKIKEPLAQVTQAFKMLKSKHRYGLTGTAVQNNMSELWCVLDWANPGCLGDLVEFKEKIEDVIMQGQRFDTNKRALANARKKSKEFAKLRDKWLLRRTKALIAHQMPTKDEKVVFCNLSDFQTNVYKEVLNCDDMEMVLRQHEECDCGSYKSRGLCCYKKNSKGLTAKQLNFMYLIFLIKVANHVALLIPRDSQSKNQQDIAKEICAKMFAKYPQFGQLTRSAAFATLSDPVYCGKMKVLVKLLDIFKKEGSKVLLFSYYTKLLDILEQYIQGTGIEYRRIDGKTPGALRVQYVHEFNKDKFIFLCLISTKAGGLGLNMTGANVVVIFDPNWNPAYDQQAQDRAYRIGQQRDVRVYRLISTGTIEENMYLRQVYKQQVASTTMHTESARRYFVGVAGDRRHHGELFGKDNIFRFGTEGCLTKDLIEREQTVEQGIKMAKYISGVVTPQTEEKETTVDEELNDVQFSDDDNCDSGDDSDEHWIASQISRDMMDLEESGDEEKETHRTTTPRSKKSAMMLSTDEQDDSESDVNDRFTRTKIVKFKNMKTKEKLDRMMKNRCEDQIDDFDSDSEIVCGQRDTHLQLKRTKLTPGGSGKRKVLKSGKAEDRDCNKGDAGKEKTSRESRKGGGKYKPSDKSLKGKGKAYRTAQSYEHCDNKSSQTSSDDGEGSSVKTKKKMKVKKVDAVDDIDNVLRECGVNYVHSNAKIIGGSKAEKHMSKCAIQDVFVEEQYSQQPANCHVLAFYDSSEESDDLGVSKKSQSINQTSTAESEGVIEKDIFEDILNPVILHNKHDNYQVGNTTVILGETPKAIRKQQFSDMVQVLGMNSQLQLAKVILGAESEKRCELLTRYYTKKHDNLPNITEFYHLKQVEEKERKEKSKATSKTKTPKTTVRKRQQVRKRQTKPSIPIIYESDDEDEEDDEDENVSLRVGARRKRKQHEGITGSKILHMNEDEKDEAGLQEKLAQSLIDNKDSQDYDANKGNIREDEILSTCKDNTGKDDAPSLHREANFSFLDDIFLNDGKHDSDHSDFGIQDKCDKDQNTSVWKRNTKYDSREAKQTQRDSEDVDIFSKYASSFVPNENYKRNREKE